MTGLWFIIILLAALLLADKQIKADKRRRREAIQWIMDVDKRWEGRDLGDYAGVRNNSNDDDEIIINLQPDGYLVADDHDEDDVDVNFSE